MTDRKARLTAIVMFAVLIMFGFIVPLVHSAEVTLQWSASENADGYKVYYGQASKEYETPEEVVETTCTLTLDDGHWYFAVTAFNKYGESEYSKELDEVIKTGTVPNLPEGLTGKVVYTYVNGLVVEVQIE